MHVLSFNILPNEVNGAKNDAGCWNIALANSIAATRVGLESSTKGLTVTRLDRGGGKNRAREIRRGNGVRFDPRHASTCETLNERARSFKNNWPTLQAFIDDL